jgi:hypothetical protein
MTTVMATILAILHPPWILRGFRGHICQPVSYTQRPAPPCLRIKRGIAADFESRTFSPTRVEFHDIALDKRF